MSRNEVQTFIETWNSEAERTLKLLESLPVDRYDFRPDPGGRSLGELAWHLAEVEAYISDGVTRGTVDFATVSGLTRPREVAALAAGYRRIHEDAVARVTALTPADLDRQVSFVAIGRAIPIRDLLWRSILHHTIHHRGQLALMNRMAGGITPGIFGPNREEMAALREKVQERN